MSDHHLYYPIFKKFEEYIFGNEDIDEESDTMWDIIKAPVFFTLALCVFIACIWGYHNNLCTIRRLRNCLAKPKKDDVPLNEVTNLRLEHII